MPANAGTSEDLENRTFTEYWLDLLHETKYLDDKQFESLQSDCKELIAILVTIIKKIKENPEKK